MAKAQQPKFEIEWRNPNELTPYERNSKLHTDEQVDAIAEQIKIAGFDQPIVIDKKNVIVKGHGRRLAAMKLKLKLVPVYVTEMDAKAARAVRIGDNKVAESPWLTDMLRIEFQDMAKLNIDIPKFTGFDMEEFNAILHGWSQDPKKGDPDGEDPGLTSRITITCQPKDKDKLTALVKNSLEGCGVKGFSIA